MIGTDFTFGDYSLSDFGLIMADPGHDDTSGLSREMLSGGTNLNKIEGLQYGAKYTEKLSVPFLIVKDYCATQNMKFEQDELRSINSWLTFSHLPQTLVVSFDESSPIELYGIFTEITPYVVDGLNGLYLTFTCTTPFAYERNELHLTNSEVDYAKSLHCTSDENRYVYPIVKIKPSFGSSQTSATFSITNSIEDKTMTFSLSDDYEEYIFDCKLKRIMADGEVLSLSDVGWDMTDIVDYNDVATGTIELYWLRFLPGINSLVFNGNGDFDIICKSPIKIGGYPYD